MASSSTPRSLATRRAVVRCCSASNVARTMLCGLVEPRLLVRMSRTPAHSSTARTGPPAMTPVPDAAGFRSTRPAPWCPMISCGMVVPASGTSTMRRRRLYGLAHRLAHLVRLAGGDPDASLPVAHGDERVEAEAPAALHDLRDAVDGNDVLDEPVALALPLARVAPLPTAPPTPAPPTPAPRSSPRPPPTPPP